MPKRKQNAIPTQAPNKGDLVPGHCVYAILPKDLPALPGKIVGTSKSGHRVTLDVGAFYAAIGLPRRTCWTWRKAVGAYQQEGCRTSKGWGLVLKRSGSANSNAA